MSAKAPQAAFAKSIRVTQAAKVAPLAAGSEADVRKSAAGGFCQIN
jgi:hypothetical protein